jgi:subtilisin family serine protease
MNSTARRARKPLAIATLATLLAGIGTWSGGAAAHGAESPLPGISLPVPATDVSASDTDLDGTAREVVVITEGADGPRVTKLRARTDVEASTLAAELNQKPGVTAALNRSYELPTDPARAGNTSDRPAKRIPLAQSAQGGSRTLAASLAAEEFGLDQWGMRAVNAEAAWTVTHGARVTVAVIDTGVDATHSDLAGHVAPQIDEVPDGLTGDVGEHGTHVAGIIAASLNGTGVAGLADKATILPIRVMDINGTCDDFTLAAGILEAVDRGAQVINMSLGGPGSSTVKQAAVKAAVDAGVTVVAAGGNSYEEGNPTMYPAAYAGVIGVSSLDPDGNSSWFANTGTYIDITAPGEEILSTVPGGWEFMDGTSMAAPFVSAAAALVRAANPTLTGAQVSSVLTSTALDDADGDGKDTVFGYGLLQADMAATKAAKATGGILAPRPVSVSVAKAGYGNVLAVNVNPNRGAGSYSFRVQKRASNGTWSTLSTVYKTEGSAETKSITLGAGTFRVVVPASTGYGSKTSAAVTLTAPTVKVIAGRDSAKSKLTVDVNPNKGSGYWTFKVQKRSGGTWKTLSTTYKTGGSAETRTVDLSAGTYRVIVAGKYGYRGAISASVALVK